jgi:hypothetical protein
MSRQTRRRISWFLGVAAVLVPAQLVMTVVLRAGQQAPAVAWASGLSKAQRLEAAARIEQYPREYRLELMKVMEPTDRAETWRGLFDRYVDAHSSLSATQRLALSRARDFLTPDLFTGRRATDVEKAHLDKITAELIRELGREDAAWLLHGLGPATVSMTALPWTVRLVQWVRDSETVSAQGACSCSQDSDWCDNPSYCGASMCEVRHPWPACGTLLMYDCNGACWYT